MALTRRRFVSGSLSSAAGLGFGWPVFLVRQSFAQPDTAPRMRLEEFVKDPKRVAGLKRAVQVMKDRDPSDPRSWFFQAAVHSVRPDWVEEAKRRDPKVAQVDQARFWNQCPHYGQESANFLLWHRAYVYYFERVLRDAAEDPTLSLPYWNYTDEAQRTFPAVFADDDSDPVTRRPRNPLFDARREAAFMAGLYKLTPDAVAVPDAKDFFGASEAEGFAGGVGDRDRNTKGLIEQAPHDLLHFAIGGSVGFGTSADPGSISGRTNGLMASVPTAAFDPIFWVHHCNIDRLWSVWDCLADRVWGAVPSQSWFAEKPWWFYDVDGSVQNLERAFYLTHGKLGIHFESDSSTCKPLSSNPPVGILASRSTGTAAASSEIASLRPPQEIGRAEVKLKLSAKVPTTRSVSFTPAPVFGAKSLLEALTVAPPSVRRGVALELDGIQVEFAPSVRYDVYVNLPSGQTPRRSAPNYVGTLALFGIEPSLGAQPVHGAVTQRFDVTKAARSKGFDPKTLRVTVVPVPLLEPREGASQLLRDGGVAIRAIRVVVTEVRQ